MRHLIWLGITLVLFVATLGLTGWSDATDLAHQREWNVVNADASAGELDGIRVRVRDARAAIADNNADQALLLVRLDRQGSSEAASAWVDCRASLQGPGGEVWLPLHTAPASRAIQFLAPDGKDNGTCNSASPGEGGAATSDQIYRLPAAALDHLTLHVSGYGTRPAALSFQLKPTVRIIESGQ